MPQSGPRAAPIPQGVHFSLDLEDHRPDDSYAPMYRDATRTVLALLGERGARATVFVVGDLARRDVGLVRDIADGGHEIGYHSAHHVPLGRSDAATFRAETAADKSFIEDLTGRPLRGYRAPSFSLTAATRWVVDLLPELGFTYSSSVLPAANPMFGFAAAPRHPYSWPNGLLELPAPVTGVGPLTVPYLGGVYFRYLPWALIERSLAARRRAAVSDFAWTYFHPFDFCPGERLYKLPYTSWPATMVLWRNRRGALDKLRRLLPDLGTETFGELIAAGAFARVPTFAAPPS